MPALLSPTPAHVPPDQGVPKPLRDVVYDWCMATVRTNIEIEETYVQTIMDRYGLTTKRAAVELALRHLAGQPMTREEALAMRGANAIEEVPADAPPHQFE